MIELAKQFVATTDDVSRLQRGDDPECAFFQQMAEHGHFGGRPGTTRQGIYVCAPSGKFLASINNNSPERVMQMLEEGLVAWDQLADEERYLESETDILPRHRWEASYPDDGLVINVLSRDLPEQCDPSQPCEAKWNQDYLWFSQDEARQWLGVDPQQNDVHEVPADVVTRLARFHLVDNVKGETPNFAAAAVVNSRITTEVIDRSGQVVKLKIAGRTEGAAGEGWWQSDNGVVSQLIGSATFDLESGTFREFEIVALGRRWGYTRFNGRDRDAMTGPIGYVFRLAPPDAPRIAPTNIASYQAEWVVHP